MIQIEGLTKIFASGTRALDRLSLQVEQGQIFGLLGPNGAGKTTAIRILSTLSGFDEGRVHVAGFDVDRDPEEVRKAIGVVAQQTGIDYFLTGRENLVLQGHLYRMAKADIKQRVNELASHFDLTEALDRPVMTYSGGMRRKLDIATALIHRPQLLFLDEPTLGLDIKSRRNLWQLIDHLNQDQGLTILLTTHYLEEADQLAHQVGIISAGQLQTVGDPETLKDAIQGDALTLTFDDQDPTRDDFATALDGLPYVRGKVWEADKLHLYVENGAESVPGVMALANDHGTQIKTLSLSHPTLDDVYLQYTGTSMEEDSGDDGGEWWQQWAGKGGGQWQKWQQQWQDEESSDDSGDKDWRHRQGQQDWGREDQQWDQQESPKGKDRDQGWPNKSKDTH